MNKKIIALFIIAVMLIVPISSIGMKDEEGMQDLFGFLNINLTEYGEEITREQAAKLYCLTGNLSENYGQSTFLDISSSEYAGYIVTAYNMGYIAVSDTTIFMPKETITCYEFARGFVKLLGYRHMAESYGYDKYIASLDLLDGIDGNYNVPLTKGTAIQVIYNALCAPYLVQTVYGTNPKYEKNNDYTILSELYQLKCVEGYVSANAVTSVYKNEGVGKDKIQIGTKLYDIKISRNDILGRYVKAFVTDDNEIKAILTDNSTNSEYVISLDNTSGTYIENGYFCWNNGKKTEKKKINLTASYIYNGCFDVDYKMDLLDDVKYGKITLLDNDGDRSIDMVFVDEYTNYIVKGVANNKIFDSHNQEFLDLESSDIEYASIRKNGEEIYIEDIKESNTASVYKSKDGKVINIEISDKVILEEITSKYEKGGYDIYTLTDKEYECAVCGTVDYTLKLGDWGKFYFDVYGRISGADLKSDIVNYGYLVAVEKDGGLGTNARFKIFNAIGKYKIFDAKSKIYFNDVKTSEQDVASALSSTAQLISYKVNSKNEIIKLNTVGNKIVQNAINDYGLWRSNSNAFASKYAVGTNTVIFNVPLDLTDFDDEDLMVISPNYLINTQQYTNINVYDMNSMHVAGAIVIRGDLPREEDHSVYFIKLVKSALDSDGNAINILKYSNGNQDAVLYTDKKIYGQIKEGTGIRITGKNANGDISSYSVEFDGTESDFPDTYIAGEKNHGISAACVTAMGVIDEVGDGIFTVEGSEYLYLASSKIFVFDYMGSRNYFEPMSFMELKKGDRVFIVKSGDVVVNVVKM